MSSSSSPPDLSSYSLRELLKLCHSHSLQLPLELPEDKQYYIDRITQHRLMMKQIADSERNEGESKENDGQEEHEIGHNNNNSGEGFITKRSRHTSGRSYFESVSASFSSVVESAAPSLSSSAISSSSSSSSDDSEGFVRIPSGTSFASEYEGRGSNSNLSKTALMHESKEAVESMIDAQGEHLARDEVEYDDADEEFARSPAVQRITQVLQNIAIFDYLEHRTSVPRFWWFVIIALILSTSIFLWVGPLAVCNFICFIYPAYCTFKTLEGKYQLNSPPPPPLPNAVDDGNDLINQQQQQMEPGEEEDLAIENHRYWLGYWVVYGLFRLFEFVGDYTLYWIPYYHPLKILFLLWCFHPSTQGCAVVYVWLIRPMFLPNESKIDRLFDRIHGSLTQASSEVKAIIIKKVAKRIAGKDDTPIKEQKQR